MTETEEGLESTELVEQVARAEDQIVEQSKRIEYYLTDYSVELLALKMDKKEFEIPGYQREDTWEDERKSRFVESLLMGLPIPFLFFWERGDGKLEIVDGSQRLRTIQQFVKSELRIGELTELTELQGLVFKNLPESRQLKIKNRSIRGIILNEHADEQARFDIFERINTGSKIANKAEVRRGALSGPFLDLVIELAKDELFVTLAPVPAKSVSLRKHEEMVTRFFAYSDGYANDFIGYKDRPAAFLFSYAKQMNEVFKTKRKITVYKDRFRQTMKFVEKAFPYGFRKTASATETRYTRFEALAVGSYLAITTEPKIKSNPPDVSSWINGEAFKEYSKSGGSNAKKRLTERLEYVRDRLLGR
ncbi:DUF262 domain-containing protein [Neorhodopirellula pilleata]|uniref:GmrSD restriction endonucleases N-terminal domain-containing protein n=1 Tax=Neorhodopirellula pilleata TaxID=2714738 RepID=A0A5C6A9V2_9BACT|nr:DUF262 domain-containing protein [Neorhodopirellula pilleata]TWT96339.1 hypothetical protein Pla100_28160 [Neorhodopirellula pilleata]